MRARTWAIATGALLLVLVAGLLLLPWGGEPEPVAPGTAEGVPATSPGAPGADPERPGTAEEQRRVAPLFDYFNSSERDPQEDVDVVLEAVEAYLLLHRDAAIPVGLNEDLVRALTTRSPYAPAFLPRDHPAIVDGQLVDRWGSPYHLHAHGDRAYSVRSAGPDRVLFTSDDILAGVERDASIEPFTPKANP